jgi:hypothetical protein
MIKFDRFVTNPISIYTILPGLKGFLFVSALAQLVHAFVTSTPDYGYSLLVEIPSYHLDKL